MNDLENHSDSEDRGDFRQEEQGNLSLNNSQNNSNRNNSQKLMNDNSLGPEVSLDNYTHVKKLLQNCQSPSDTFKIFSTMLYNTLSHRNKVGRSFPKNLMENYEEAMNDTSKRISQLTKFQTRSINQNNNLQNMDTKIKSVDKKIDKLINNSESLKDNKEQLGQIREIIPKIQVSLKSMEKYYKETLKNIKDTLNSQKQGLLGTEGTIEASNETLQKENKIQRDPKTNQLIVHYIKFTPLKEKSLDENMDDICQAILNKNLPEPDNFSTNKQGKIFLHYLKKNEYNTVRDFFLDNPDKIENLKVHRYSKQRTRLILYNTFYEKHCTFEEIEEHLKIHEFFIDSEIEVIRLFDSSKEGKRHLIIEVNKENADILLKKRQLNINFQSFLLAQYIEIKKCSNCQELGHYSGNCRKDAKCNVCGQNHKTQDCNTMEEHCINCEKQGSKDLAHKANSKNCHFFINYKKAVFANILSPQIKTTGKQRENEGENNKQ